MRFHDTIFFLRNVLVIASLLLLSQVTYTQPSNTFSNEYDEIWERAKAYTLVMVKAMPDSLLDFKPVEDVRSFREQVGHMMDNMSFLQYYITGERDSPIRGLTNNLEQQSKEQLLTNLEVSFDYIGFMIQNLTDQSAEEPVSFFEKEIAMNKRGIIRLMRNHVTHHRAQLIIYLRLNNIVPPRYVGW